MQETQVRTVGREDPLEQGVATHSLVLAWGATAHGVLKEPDTT